MAFDSGWFGGRLRRQDVAFLVDALYCLAVGVVGAAQEGSEPSGLLEHGLAAVGALVFGGLFGDDFSFVVAWGGELAFGVSRAAQESAVLSETVDHFGVAFGAVVIAGCGFGSRVLHLFESRVEVILEGTIEFAKDTEPVEVLLFYFVELVLHVPGEGDIHDAREELAELVGDDLSDGGGPEVAVDFLDVLSVLYCADD